jgi:hypothetical protein
MKMDYGKPGEMGTSTVVKDTLLDSSRSALTALNKDSEVFRNAHTDIPMDCGWAMFWSWSSGVLAVASCTAGLATMTCVGFVYAAAYNFQGFISCLDGPGGGTP